MFLKSNTLILIFATLVDITLIAVNNKRVKRRKFIQFKNLICFFMKR